MNRRQLRSPKHTEILRSLAECLDVDRVLEGHPEWTREDVRQALEAGVAGLSEAHPPAETRSLSLKKLPESVVLYADGASRGNPGPAGAGVVFCDESGATLGEAYEYLGKATNNVAEYKALLLGLRTALEGGVRRILFRCDSELLASQLRGVYKVRSRNLKGLYEEARRLIAELEAFKAEHVYREANTLADALANSAIDEAKTKAR